MSFEVLLRFAPAYDPRHFDDDAPGSAPDLLVSTDALHTVKRNEPTPVVIDHDLANVVGHVANRYVFNDVDYGTRVRRWWFASCELDRKPSWLKRGSAVSWSYHPLHTYAASPSTTVLTSCMLKEVSVLSPALAPAEPLARVVLVREKRDADPKPAHRHEPSQVIAHRPKARRADSDRDELERRIEWIEGRTGRPANIEAIIAAMQRELHGPSILDMDTRFFQRPPRHPPNEKISPRCCPG